MSLERIKMISNRIKIFEHQIYDFDGEYKLTSNGCVPEKDGYYLTIRCGLGGIYSMINEFKNGKWQASVADASTTIAFSKTQFDMDGLIESVDKELGL